MTQPLPELVGAPTEDYSSFSRLFIEREAALLLLVQLNHLLKAVQRHRGISMGMLAGNTDFMSEFQSLQHQLKRRLATLEAFARANQLLSDRDKDNLSLAWATIRSNWEGDNLNDNFELHSHFIEQLLAMIGSLARRLAFPILQPNMDSSESLVGSGFSSLRMRQQQGIIEFITKVLPETIERVARIRGTAAYAAAVMSTEGLDARKLRYWIGSLRDDVGLIRQQAEKLHDDLGAMLPKLLLVKQNEQQLLQFLSMAESSVFMGNGGRGAAHRLFVLASDVIDIYWEVVTGGLALVQQWQREELEAWVALPSFVGGYPASI